ncbi:MAG: oligopeptide transporter, OPT family [Muribaculaceae bacterium]|nr:oligopeptide transporter, OPT family [Muribaculaceae bacterium]
MEEQLKDSLPENAFRELQPGEEYKPVMSPDKNYREVTPWSVTWGILMAILFSAAAAYLGLKVGQVFEAAIPIAIIAVGLSKATKRNNALGENVIIQSIGACSGNVVAGAIFTLPALYMLDLDASFMQIFLSSLIGGILGILFLIPFRKYFVSDMHGKYPFPEATATTQILISGQKKGNQAKPLIIAGLIGGLYDFILSTFAWWSEVLSTRFLPFGEMIADKAKTVFKINTGAAVLGLGYIVGLKYCTIICAGSIFVWFVLIPGMSAIFGDVMLSTGITEAVKPIGAMSAEEIFANYARYIGIGGIAMAGLIGIIKSWGVIKGAVSLAGRELKGKTTQVAVAVKRTDRDLSMKFIVISAIITLVAMLMFFYFGIISNVMQAVIAFIVVAVIAFLFTTVAANAIAIVGTNPVSGMTLMTLVISSVILVAVGLEGDKGMLAALIIGGVVCTALSTAGGFVTDLKIGYWLGSSPRKQESWKFLGTLVSAVTVGGVILILDKTYGWTGEGALVAPQANAMKAVIEPMMSGQGAPWMLYGIGAAIALLLTVLKVPALAFALGMFIPLELNTPLVVGGLISWYVSTRSKDSDLNKARQERGTLLASGFIAGGALMGVISAAMKFGGFEYTSPVGDLAAQIIGLVVYIALIAYLVWDSMRAKKEDA